MTREEKISQATHEYIEDVLSDRYSVDFEDIEFAFQSGVEWADKNPNMSLLWHDITEEPLVGNTIVYLTKNHAIGTLKRVDKSRFDWYIEKYAICKWTYMKDLLPKGGEAWNTTN